MARRLLKSGSRSGLFLALLLMAGCATVPYSGRRQLAFLPEADLVGMSFEAYREVLAFGLGSQIGVLLPYSRAHEYEADRLRAVLMAKAGYDPRSAIDFWSRMLEISGETSFGFLSTHPATKKRIRDMNKFMPEALRFYLL